MTREEAIAYGKECLSWNQFSKGMKMYQFIEMAISALNSLEEVYAKGYDDGFTQAEVNFENDKALSQEPCDDTYNIRKDILKCRVGNIVAYNVEWLKKHWQMEMDIVCGVEPCEDAISREAVLDTTICEGISCNECSFNEIDGESGCLLHARIDELPSVTQKSGKWIDKDLWKEEYVLTGKCSVCGQVRVKDKFCSNCGARMESEDDNTGDN